MWLTVRPGAHAGPKALGEGEPVLKFINALPHGEETLIGLAHAREGIDECVGNVLNEPGPRVRSRRMSNMLMHDDLLLK